MKLRSNVLFESFILSSLGPIYIISFSFLLSQLFLSTKNLLSDYVHIQSIPCLYYTHILCFIYIIFIIGVMYWMCLYWRKENSWHLLFPRHVPLTVVTTKNAQCTWNLKRVLGEEDHVTSQC